MVLSAVIYLGAVFGVTLFDNSLLNKILIVGPLVLLLVGGVYAVYKVWRLEYERRGAFFLPVRPKPGPTRQGTRQVGAWRKAGSVGAEDVNDEDQGVGALDPGL